MWCANTHCARIQFTSNILTFFHRHFRDDRLEYDAHIISLHSVSLFHIRLAPHHYGFPLSIIYDSYYYHLVLIYHSRVSITLYTFGGKAAFAGVNWPKSKHTENVKSEPDVKFERSFVYSVVLCVFVYRSRSLVSLFVWLLCIYMHF